MNRKHMPLWIGGVVALLLAAALGFWLVKSRGEYSETRQSMEREQRRLEKLSERKPFPSRANVATLEQQLGLYQEYLDGLFDMMKEDQAEREPIDHDRFRRLLEQTLRRLVRGAHDQGITLPAGFTFGFQPYVEGMRPEEEDLERLVDQLRSVYLLCQVLYTSGVKEIVSIERTVFEEGAQVTEPDAEYDRRRRRRTEPEVEESSTDLVRDPDGLFTRETYVLTYRAGDEANWLVLDSLAKGSPFVVITQMDIVNSARPVVVPPKTAPAPEAAAPAAAAGTAGWLAPGARNAAAGAMRQEETVLPRDLRVVAGRENPLVRLQVDLYEFAGEEAPAEEGEESP